MSIDFRFTFLFANQSTHIGVQSPLTKLNMLAEMTEQSDAGS